MIGDSKNFDNFFALIFLTAENRRYLTITQNLQSDCD